MVNADLASLIARLETAPAALRGALSQIRPGMVEQRTAGDEWSVADVIRHLRAADAITGTRVFHILVSDDAPLPAFDEVAWARLLAAGGAALADQVEAFALRRSELVAILRTLDAARWNRAGEHEVRGRMTVAELCEDIATHEAEHRAQLEALIGTMSV